MPDINKNQTDPETLTTKLGHVFNKAEAREADTRGRWNEQIKALEERLKTLENAQPSSLLEKIGNFIEQCLHRFVLFSAKLFGPAQSLNDITTGVEAVAEVSAHAAKTAMQALKLNKLDPYGRKVLQSLTDKVLPSPTPTQEQIKSLEQQIPTWMSDVTLTPETLDKLKSNSSSKPDSSTSEAASVAVEVEEDSVSSPRPSRSV